MRRIKVGMPFDLKARVEAVKPCRTASTVPKGRVTVGREFDLQATVSRSAVSYDAETRRRLVYWVLALMTAFLVGAAVYGIWKGDFGAIQVVWTAVAPLYGFISAYFFAPKGSR